MTQVLERLEKLCVLHLDAPESDAVRFAVQPTVEGSVAAFAQLKQTEWFEGYRIESQNGNEIGLEMDLQNLTRALRSASSADEVHVKLAKKGVPVLTFEIRTHLGPIMQDVPVTVMSAARLAECREPEVETRVRGFTLPNLSRLYNVVERMKGLGTRMELLAEIGERFASLAVQMLTDNVSVSTVYEKLPIASMSFETETAESPGEELVQSDCTVDLKNLRGALYGYQIQPKHGICFILRNCVLVHLMGDGSSSADISYYIPLIAR